ncbi:RING-H2 finger protein ATL65 [Acorus gramineus]|uniref:RING-type E3 ubiquitin transferase n=1 Tax=Acorus gramineus TaxID=55184 RepID=A0AAV9B0C0_ACOGR|nr:RING-H2 finger protein ATL65 [Acorus gramineus]
MESPTPSPSPQMGVDYEFEWGGDRSPAAEAAHPHHPHHHLSSSTTTSPSLSPALIAMIAVVGAALLIVLYARLLRRYRRWRRRRRLRRALLFPSPSDPRSPPPPPPLADLTDDDSYFFFSPYGLDESAIKTLPVYVYEESDRVLLTSGDCAVCLIEFDEGDCVRTLPDCAHAFHVDCIDAWLRSHANCPLCRSRILPPFTLLGSSRIRPTFDDDVISAAAAEANTAEQEITPVIEPSPPQTQPRSDLFLLKRSYSFGFERTFASEAATASPWRSRRHHHHRSSGGFWSRRMTSPFMQSKAGRVFSFRYYRGPPSAAASTAKSPFPRRRSFFLPLSERFSGVGSRRSKSMASPAATGGWWSSSRMRCGDPEALLSPERLNRR